MIIAGFGRYGQIVGRLLSPTACSATVLDHDAEQIETVRRFGWKVFYGDATRLDLLRMAGAGERARAGAGHRRRRAERGGGRAGARAFPAAEHRGARAQRHATTTGCATLGVTLIERETLDSALMSARSVLELMGWERHTRAQPGAALSPAQHRADASAWRRISATRSS